MWVLEIFDKNAFEQDYDFCDKHTLEFKEMPEAIKFLKEFNKHCPYDVIYKLYERTDILQEMR